MSEWKLIDSAPKDGTPVMLYGPIAGEIGGIYDAPPQIVIGAYGRAGRSDYKGFDWVCENTDAYCVWCNPTHWQPLPEPPKETDK